MKNILYSIDNDIVHKRIYWMDCSKAMPIFLKKKFTLKIRRMSTYCQQKKETNKNKTGVRYRKSSVAGFRCIYFLLFLFRNPTLRKYELI